MFVSTARNTNKHSTIAHLDSQHYNKNMIIIIIITDAHNNTSIWGGWSVISMIQPPFQSQSPQNWKRHNSPGSGLLTAISGATLAPLLQMTPRLPPYTGTSFIWREGIWRVSGRVGGSVEWNIVPVENKNEQLHTFILSHVHFLQSRRLVSVVFTREEIVVIVVIPMMMAAI